MPFLTGLLLVLLAGLLQGTFVLPMTLVKRWSWEHTWATFSVLGMFVFNWALTILFVPSALRVYAVSPAKDLATLALFGAGWGVGAILFGLGMEKLGMALGYPIIMGLIASLGSFIPLVIFLPQALLSKKGLLLMAGTAIVIVGIILCSKAGSGKESAASESGKIPEAKGFHIGLLIAVLAGVLSCLPNIGVAFSGPVVVAAEALGVSKTAAGNAVWALLFTFGCVVNLAYCAYLMVQRKSLGQFWNEESARNLLLSILMAAMWIGSFYLYGAGAARLGRWGVIAGWPLFISVAIVMGNMWGLWRGEWRNARPAARRLLNSGLLILIVAVILIALSNLLG
jgi:L-rhamnose-H+ transport protein